MEIVFATANRTVDQRFTKSLTNTESSPVLVFESAAETTEDPIFKTEESEKIIRHANVSSKINRSPRVGSLRPRKRCARKVPAAMDTPIWIAKTVTRRQAS